jgi:hypothetical protein
MQIARAIIDGSQEDSPSVMLPVSWLLPTMLLTLDILSVQTLQPSSLGTTLAS